MGVNLSKRKILIALEGVIIAPPKIDVSLLGVEARDALVEVELVPGAIEALTALRQHGFEVTLIGAADMGHRGEKVYVSPVDGWRMRLDHWGVPYDVVLVYPLFAEAAARFDGTAIIKRPRSWYKTAVELLAQPEPTDQRMNRYLDELRDSYLRLNAVVENFG